MSIQKIIVCMDDEPESLRALEEAIPLARKVGAEIVLTHVGELYSSYPNVGFLTIDAVEAYHALIAAREADMRAQLSDVRQRHLGQGVDFSVSLLDGDPGSAIPDAEEELGADLVVVGSHGRSGFRRLFAGSVAERIVRRSEKSVLVARNEAPRVPYRRILIATDFSPASEQAVRMALLFAAPDAEVTLFHSWQLPTSASGTNPLLGRLAESIEAQTDQNMDKLLRKFEGDFVLGKEITYGHPAPLLRQRASEFDLIALGSNGYRGVSRWVLGSVAELTVRHAPCSVLVARAQAA